MKVPARIPKIIQVLGPNLLFRVETSRKEVFLTFDDGPIEGLTPWTLDCLSQFEAKATFFMVGENVKRNPHLVERVISEGHSLGNHTLNHLNGFKTRQERYLDNVVKCDEALLTFGKNGHSRLFRPPYGCILPGQANKLRKMGFTVVMWDVLSKDYDLFTSPEEVEKNVIDNIQPGSIVVFHDNLKAEKNVQVALPRVLNQLKEAGYEFGRL